MTDTRYTDAATGEEWVRADTIPALLADARAEALREALSWIESQRGGDFPEHPEWIKGRRVGLDDAVVILKRLIDAPTPAPAQPSVQEAARVSDRFHKEQVDIWAQEILEALALNELININTYDDKVTAHRIVSRELVDIGKALDTLDMVNRGALRALASEDQT